MNSVPDTGTVGTDLPRVAGLLVTYRRPVILAETLEALDEQSVRLVPLVVVDNDPGGSARAIVPDRDDIVYLAAGDNGGPAGAYRVGLDALPDDVYWVMFLDDDDPPEGPGVVESLVRFLSEAQRYEARCVGVGSTGATFDRASGRSANPDLNTPDRFVSVDWIGSGRFPIYSVAALRSANVGNAPLFWGFEDLGIGLALRDQGGVLFRDRDFRVEPRFDRLFSKPPKGFSTWQAFYTTRNLTHLVRQHGRTSSAVLVGLRTALGRIKRCPRPRRALLARLMARAVVDGLRGRLGRTVEPAEYP